MEDNPGVTPPPVSKLAYRGVLEQTKPEDLISLKGDLADWLNKTLGVVITTESFMSVLEDGVVVCRLAKHIREKAQNKAGQQDVPAITFKEQLRNKFHKRDNVSKFLSWAKQFGVNKECLFETDYLVDHKNERNVVVCLLEIARKADGYGIEPPKLVKMAKEIVQEETAPVTATPRKPKSRVNVKVSPKKPLDREVRIQNIFRLETSTCTCSPRLQLIKLEEDSYMLGDKTLCISPSEKGVISVRVGGGWQPLPEYLQRHDPCKIRWFQQGNKSFLHIQGKYKSK